MTDKIRQAAEECARYVTENRVAYPNHTANLIERAMRKLVEREGLSLDHSRLAVEKFQKDTLEGPQEESMIISDRMQGVDCPYCEDGTTHVHKPAPTAGEEELVKRITGYLALGGLFNPEMAIHDRVRDLLIDCRHALVLRRMRS